MKTEEYNQSWQELEDIKVWCEDNLECLSIEGTTRIVFKHPYIDWVIKVPRAVEYLKHNVDEFKRSKIYPSAKCYVEHIGSIPIIHMERVNVLIDPDSDYCQINFNDYPEWIQLLEMSQVGYTKNGELVFYDLGE